MMNKQRGFTLIEIAIVLVIIGLLLGGILKGQEMINSAKVRNLADTANSVKAAFFAFQDRYRAVPGDYINAVNNIPGVAGNGLGNGQVNTNGERGLFWNHLGAAGFLSGTFNGAATPNNLNCPSTTCPANSFGRPMMFSWGSAALGTNQTNHEIRIGRGLPVEVMAELDRKVDDGIPLTGSFQVDQQANPGGNCSAGAGVNSIYPIAVGNPETDCGGVFIL